MNQKAKHTKASVLERPSVWSELQLLFKFKLSITVVFSSVMAYAICATQFDLIVGVVLTVGGILVTGAANALNQALEREYDAQMDRTKNRPLASNRMTLSQAVLIAGLSAMIGTLLLTWVNPLAGFVGMLSLVLYAFIYTPMKRYGPVAVFVGAVPGALPVLIGAIVGQGEVTVLGMILFGIQFFWQLPHFWAIAWLGHEDYTRAGFKLLPNATNTLHPSIGVHSAIQAAFILPLLVLGALYGGISWLAVIGLAVLTGWYILLGMKLFKAPGREMARKLMFGSFAYLPIALFILLIDSLIL